MHDSSVEFNKTKFYGKKGLEKARNWKERLRSREHEFFSRPATPQYRPRFDSPSAQWKIFHRQKEAFDFAQAQSKELHVFAFESESFLQKGGQRLYLVASLEHFWHYYQGMNRSQRHHYEVIPEGAVCRLYFDLEFQKEFNMKKDGPLSVSILIKYICCQLREMYNIDCHFEDILILDASTASKFSQHLIFHLENAAFKCNVTAGNFVHSIMQQALEEIHGKWNKEDCEAGLVQVCGMTREELREILVKDKDGKEIPICDMGVYTRNRNFRLYLSCKMGKNNPLSTANENKFVASVKKRPRYIKPSSQQQLFLDSLVTAPYESGMRILTCESRSRVRKTVANQTARPTEVTEDVKEGRDVSPFPAIDTFIAEQAERWGQGSKGKVRQWIYFSHGQLIIYNIQGNRWCGRMKREHKSNKIMLIVDLKHRVFYQKCHDPECKALNYKSCDHPLPYHLFPSMFDEEVNDEELIDAALTVEAQQQLDFMDDVDDQDLIQAVEDVENA